MLDAGTANARRMTAARPYALHHPKAWGAEPLGQGRWRFALWAPQAGTVDLDLGGARQPMARDAEGFWRATAEARADAPYAFVVDGQATPDPLARAQMGTDVMGPSRLLDPRRHAWTSEWRGRPWEEAVLYELHVGTFTPEGTWEAATRRLPGLAALGITALELMPVPHGPGMRGWGYDGALLLAPHPAYGSPEDMKRFVEEAQRHGIMVLLDLVMNHFAPQDSDMHRIAPGFFDPEQSSPWGAAIDFGQPAVRRFFLDLCLGWITEYRLDGLRFDAVHEIRDPDSPVHFMEELGHEVRARDFGRPIHLVNEDARNAPTLIRDGASTAQWADDFHHSMHPLLTGEGGGYMAEYAENPVEKLRHVLGEGFAKPGDEAPEPEEGLPVFGLPWTAFVCHNQNHDQIGNRPDGARLINLVRDERGLEVAHALLLTSPFVPMLWMGEEEGERGPFHYFCDVDEELAEAIREGRKEQFGKMFGSDDFPDPNDRRTMEESRPFTDSGSEHARHWRDLTRRLLALRHERIVPLLKSGRAGPARIERRGPAALSATWPFHDGFVVAHANLGTPPDEPPTRTEPHDIALGDIARDPYAFALLVSRP
ncbi:Malto-oligosyltrehalose trehalohydrolase [Rubellimicrobium mesophilum DSM 19309]|uniref:Malto-oligosyltrehalose trehalohydrolase n=1 Tax=Rubellimicrobium mesophilum DSM 19309 TaxID=442562 RepID=A0A017HM27_9RHOB|nr:malto-oligosyltrehalose trehalohydrolase [Rubellimicrobium mesophilum]EYD75218.1 Malto-oligosyltrehalose trehalohydrolase [Rubellimicrobium mesophilum DSM 19309]